MVEKTLVVGIGNPLRGDDGVGPAVAEAICRGEGDGRECLAFTGSGLDLLGLFGGYGRAVLIDSLANGQLAEGECARLELPGDGAPPGPGPTAHYIGVADALRLARHLKVALPRDIRFYGVGVRPASEWREGLGAAVAARVPAIALEIEQDLRPGMGEA